MALTPKTGPSSASGTAVSGPVTVSRSRARPSPNCADTRRSGAGGTRGRPHSTKNASKAAAATTAAQVFARARCLGWKRNVTNPSSASAPASRMAFSVLRLHRIGNATLAHTNRLKAKKTAVRSGSVDTCRS